MEDVINSGFWITVWIYCHSIKWKSRLLLDIMNRRFSKQIYSCENIFKIQLCMIRNDSEYYQQYPFHTSGNTTVTILG